MREFLANPEWLRVKHHIEKLSLKEIASIIVCSPTTVGNALRRHDIEILRHPRKIRGSKYDELNDRAFLEQKYLVEKLSIRDISALVGCASSASVRQALLRNGIPVRNISEGITCNRSSVFVCNPDVIDGTLLGDANLTVWNNESDISLPYYKKKNKYLDHIMLAATALLGEAADEHVTSELDSRYELVYHTLRTKTQPSLKDFYLRWYPKENGFKKVIPNDVSISPTALLHWFLDDGSSYQRRKNSAKKQVVITLSTECFSLENQQMLVDKIEREYDISFSIYPTNSGVGHRMVLPQKYSPEFYRIIGPPQPASLAYKWK